MDRLGRYPECILERATGSDPVIIAGHPMGGTSRLAAKPCAKTTVIGAGRFSLGVREYAVVRADAGLPAVGAMSDESRVSAPGHEDDPHDGAQGDRGRDPADAGVQPTRRRVTPLAWR